MRTFEFKDGKSHKFWHIELSGPGFTVHFGRIGTNGQKQGKTFADAATAKKEHDKLVAEKLKKGYAETTPGATAASAAPAKATSSEQQALEAALVEHADEVAAHSAYADYLMEQGDPRGEFVQVQLSLEDASLSKKERDALRKREAALLKEHAKGWLGELGRFLVGAWSGEGKPYCYRFARGWLDYLRVLPEPEAMFEYLFQSPETRLLRRLEIVYDMRYHPFNFHEFQTALNKALPEDERIPMHSFVENSSIPELFAASRLMSNLRVLKYGFSDDHKEGPSHSSMIEPFGANTAKKILGALKSCPRLEELYLNVDISGADTLLGSPLLGNLRVFQYYYGSTYRSFGEDHSDPYPLSKLAKNKSLKNLTTLRFHPGRDASIGIDDLDALLNSKNLPALAHLQIHMTTYGDEGADRIVSSGILKRLKTLDIGYGNMTDGGARMLSACPDLKNLDVLNVSQNALTQTGVKALQKTGVRIIADDQHNDDPDDHSYLYGVDWE